MDRNNTNSTRVEKFIAELLETYFGENEAKIQVTITKPFVVIYLQHFILPTEKILAKRKEWKRIAETRDLLINGIKSEILQKLGDIIEAEAIELYVDWNLENKTGLFIALLNEETNDAREAIKWSDETERKALKEEVTKASTKTEKTPDHIEVFEVAPSIILIERSGIMVEIEKELIKNGVIEELRLAKRPLEHRLMGNRDINGVLNRSIAELFIDWDFEGDKAYMVLLLES
jgi:uncharacterized protein YbcI